MKTKNKLKIITLTAGVLFLTHVAGAALIAEYDLAPSPAPNFVVPSYVASGYSVSNLQLNNPANTYTPFSNHFYHNGWSGGFDPSKYYQVNVGGSNPFTLSSVNFSLENTGGSSTYWLRSSLDGFSSTLSSGNFLNGLVTDFNVNLSPMGTISAPVTFRWYIASGSVAGFANHEPGGSGGGLSDVGQDLTFYGDQIPEPASIGLLGLISGGIYFTRRFFIA